MRENTGFWNFKLFGSLNILVDNVNEIDIDLTW